VEGRRAGLDTPFIRPAWLSSDTATSLDMWRHAWIEAERAYGDRFDLSVLLEPTSPLRRPDDVQRTVALLVERGAGCAVTVSPTPSHFAPEKCLVVSDDGVLGFYLADGPRPTLRQGLPRYYHRNGLCYAVTRAHLLDRGRLLGVDTVALVVDRPVVNVDDPFELELASWLEARERV
jgi:CMP-N-acetylneuraminic acid synthetase